MVVVGVVMEDLNAYWVVRTAYVVRHYGWKDEEDARRLAALLSRLTGRKVLSGGYNTDPYMPAMSRLPAPPVGAKLSPFEKLRWSPFL